MHLDTQKTLISQSSLIDSFDLSRSGLDKLRKKDPSFPRPIRDGHHRQAKSFYVVAEVEAWIRAQIEKRDQAEYERLSSTTAETEK